MRGWCLWGSPGVPGRRDVSGEGVGQCGVPALLEGVEEVSFDGGADVGVDLSDVVVEGVAEASGLGDFGDVVFDHPGFVAVAEFVEG